MVLTRNEDKKEKVSYNIHRAFLASATPHASTQGPFHNAVKQCKPDHTGRGDVWFAVIHPSGCPSATSFSAGTVVDLAAHTPNLCLPPRMTGYLTIAPWSISIPRRVYSSVSSPELLVLVAFTTSNMLQWFPTPLSSLLSLCAHPKAISILPVQLKTCSADTSSSSSSSPPPPLSLSLRIPLASTLLCHQRDQMRTSRQQQQHSTASRPSIMPVPAPLPLGSW